MGPKNHKCDKCIAMPEKTGDEDKKLPAALTSSGSSSNADFSGGEESAINRQEAERRRALQLAHDLAVTAAAAGQAGGVQQRHVPAGQQQDQVPAAPHQEYAQQPSASTWRPSGTTRPSAVNDMIGRFADMTGAYAWDNRDVGNVRNDRQFDQINADQENMGPRARLHVPQGAALPQQPAPARGGQLTMRDLTSRMCFFNCNDTKYDETTMGETINFPMENTERMDPTVRLRRKLADMKIDRDAKAIHFAAAAEDKGIDTVITRQRYGLGEKQLQEIVNLDQAIGELESQLNQKIALRDAYKPRLKIPKATTCRGLNLEEFDNAFDKCRKNIEKADGKNSTVEHCWKKLLRYGEPKHWSHNNYKEALGRMLIGDAFECYEDFAEEPLESILKELSTRFGARQMFQSIEKLEAFSRNAGESLEAAFGRLRGLITHVLPTFREADKPQKIESISRTALMSVASPSALIRINDTIAQAVQAGDIATFEDLMNAAQSAELSNRDTPRTTKNAGIRIFAHTQQDQVDSAITHTVVNEISQSPSRSSSYRPPKDNNYSSIMGRSDSSERQSTSPKPAMSQRADAAVENRRGRSRDRQSRDRSNSFNKNRDLTPAYPKVGGGTVTRQSTEKRAVDWSKAPNKEYSPQSRADSRPRSFSRERERSGRQETQGRFSQNRSREREWRTRKSAENLVRQQDQERQDQRTAWREQGQRQNSRNRSGDRGRQQGRYQDRSQERGRQQGGYQDRSQERGGQAGRYPNRSRSRDRAASYDRVMARPISTERSWSRDQTDRGQGSQRYQTRGRSQERGPRPQRQQQGGQGTWRYEYPRQASTGRREQERDRPDSRGPENNTAGVNFPYSHKNTTYVLDASAIVATCDKCRTHAMMPPTMCGSVKFSHGCPNTGKTDEVDKAKSN